MLTSALKTNICTCVCVCVLEQAGFLVVDRQHADLSRPLDCVDAICQPQSHGVLQGFCVIVHVHNLHACRGRRGRIRGGGGMKSQGEQVKVRAEEEEEDIISCRCSASVYLSICCFSD